MPQGLTVLAAISPAAEMRLQDVLRAIGNDIAGKTLRDTAGRPHVDFPRSRTIHFARFAILDDPDRGPTRKRLLYSSNYDGELDAHLNELIAITSDMDAVWGACEAYTGASEFVAFIHAHACEPEAFYIAFRDGTVEQVWQSIALRRRLQPLLDAAPAGSLQTVVPGPPKGEPVPADRIRRTFAATGREIRTGITRLLRALPLVVDLPRAVFRCGFSNVLQGTRKITASLDRIAVFRFLNQVTRNRLPPMQSIYSSARLENIGNTAIASGEENPSRRVQALPAFREDVVTQNQLTLVTVVREGHVDRVRAVMAAINSYSRRLSPPGSLIGVSTIHFVRWLLLDEGRRLMMVSDYDGSWESYIDEFAELILSGLDAIWETSHGYPSDGARDVPAFKQFLRDHQEPSEVFYSAYPEETVLNIISDRALAIAWSDPASDRLDDLLAQL
jgi:hypothetical protein